MQIFCARHISAINKKNVVAAKNTFVKRNIRHGNADTEQQVLSISLSVSPCDFPGFEYSYCNDTFMDVKN